MPVKVFPDPCRKEILAVVPFWGGDGRKEIGRRRSVRRLTRVLVPLHIDHFPPRWCCLGPARLRDYHILDPLAPKGSFGSKFTDTSCITALPAS